MKHRRRKFGTSWKSSLCPRVDPEAVPEAEIVWAEDEEGSDLAEHINVFNQLIVDLEKVDVKIDEEDRAIILLCSLPGSYEHLVTTLTYGKEDVKVDVKVDGIVTALLGHE